MQTIKISFLVIFSLFCMNSCKNSTETNEPTNEEEVVVDVEISKETLADELGDENGVASSYELDYIDEYFNTNEEMWLITGFNTQKVVNGRIKATEIKAYLLIWSRAYLSEMDLRNENIGRSIRTPWIGISVLVKNEGIFITRLFLSPGPNFASVEWQELKIIE